MSAPQNPAERDSVGKALARTANPAHAASLLRRALVCLRTRGWQALWRETFYRLCLVFGKEPWQLRADVPLRKELREAGVEYFVVKNTMLRLAVKETGLAGLADVLKGSTALAVSKEDPTAAARILNKFAEGSKGKFSLKSGYMEGKVLDEAELTAIAKLPDYKGMLSMFAGALTSTLSGLAVAMQAYVDKQEEPAA